MSYVSFSKNHSQDGRDSHTHSCNPPGRDDASHSHTCFHTHTHLIIPDPQENDNSDISGHVGTERQRGKYREKKKARTAYLEDEVKRLQSLNEYLLRKLQSQRMVETEIIKLRALLVEMQVKIDDELGVFSFQKQCNGSGFVFKEGDVSLLSVCVGYIYDIGDK
ncbi:LOW QUALITY PROTEIN: basic leucine zipper 24 [Brassica rapa]|uniref:LOW QUALITY PROTEIN: basic leucine zipper 24 n=1 Tax=Brassica campestris TaxID=3711 RepID=UPI00142E0938|nr:LOW QUALITY PROTEIN: basic leucine zipper 24 [Brassica rapa]